MTKQFRLRTLLIALTMIGIIVGVVSMYFHHVNRTTRNAYAQWWVADMVIEHLDANNSDWPTNWEDLRDDYDVCVAKSGQPWSFEELKRRVFVNWEINSSELANEITNGNHVELITLRDGTLSQWEGRDPNQMIVDYFLKKTAD